MENKSYAALDLETLAALDPNTSYAKIRELVGSGKRVLDVGCGPGNLATILSRMGNVVVGIDKDDGALAAAQRVCERTIAADLDDAELGELVADERFDVVVFADVLEHVRNPVKLLTSSRRVLREAGCIIVSIPNVAHGAVRLALLRGRFEYQQLGILDDTHLRFYTRESVLRLLSESGFAAVRLERTTASVFERSDLVPLVRREDYDAAVVADVMRDEDAETLQFVVRAAPVAEGQVAAVLTAEITGLQQSVRMLRAQLAQAHDAAEAARAEAAPAHANGASSGRADAERADAERAEAARAEAEAERLAEVERHYRNALELADATRAELDALRRDAAQREAAAAASAEESRLGWERERAEWREREQRLGERERQLAGRAEQLAAAAEAAAAKAESLRGELTQRDAAVASSAAAAASSAAAATSAAAALEGLRAEYHAAAAQIEPLRAELSRVQRAAEGVAADRDAALGRAQAAEGELARASAAALESQESLRCARALLAEVERELSEALAERDDAVVRAELAEAGVPEAGLAGDAALARRVTDLESLLAVERASREHVEESADRILAVARDREARAEASELRRLLACSAVVDMELTTARTARRRIPLPPVPPPTALPPALVLRAATSGRRTLTVLPPRAGGRRERLRAGWRRLRQLLPLALLLAIGSGA